MIRYNYYIKNDLFVDLFQSVFISIVLISSITSLDSEITSIWMTLISMGLLILWYKSSTNNFKESLFRKSIGIKGVKSNLQFILYSYFETVTIKVMTLIFIGLMLIGFSDILPFQKLTITKLFIALIYIVAMSFHSFLVYSLLYKKNYLNSWTFTISLFLPYFLYFIFFGLFYGKLTSEFLGYIPSSLGHVYYLNIGINSILQVVFAIITWGFLIFLQLKRLSEFKF